ncbi:hypothetical protein OF83DRAFT_267940 [Amylostereum chailletii]|nr:hypothetical protein OF83DRAFT_267940 [Amylostereum chailletii]
MHQMVTVSPSSLMPVSTQRKLLDEREARWRSLRWKSVHSLPIPSAGAIYEFVGGIYCNALGHGDDRRASSSISFYQLPSTLPDQDNRILSWTLSVFQMDVIDFSIDPSQDLLVLVASAPPKEKCCYQIHLRTLSTNEPHPLAQSPVLNCMRDPPPVDAVDMWTSFRIQILGNYLIVLIKDVFHTSSAFLALWNWHAGPDACFHIPENCGIDDVCFLSPTEYLLVVPRGYLEVYSFLDPATTDTLPTLVRRFGLPKLKKGFRYWYVSATANPTPASQVYNRDPALTPLGSFVPPPSNSSSGHNSQDGGSSPLSKSSTTSSCTSDAPHTAMPRLAPPPPFHARPDDGLIACSLGTLNPNGDNQIDCFVFFIHIHTLLNIAHTYTPASPPQRKLVRTLQRSANVFRFNPEDRSSEYVPIEPYIATPYLATSSTSAGPSSPPRAPRRNRPRLADPTTPVPWTDWGPGATRWFADKLSSDWQHAVHGFRTAERVGADGGVPDTNEQGSTTSRHRIRVRDFNPYVVRRARRRAEDGAEEGDEEETGDEEGEIKTTRRLVTEPSIIPARETFLEDVRSCLPYREVMTEEPVEVSDIMMDDSRILCLKRDQAQLLALDILTF